MAEEKWQRLRLESHQSEISNVSTFTQSTQLSSENSYESDEPEKTMTDGPKQESITSSQSRNHNKLSKPAASQHCTSLSSPTFKQDSGHAYFYLEYDQEQNVFNFENVPQSNDNACATKINLPTRVRRNTDGDIHFEDRINNDMHNDIGLGKYMHRSHNSSCRSMRNVEQRVLSQQPSLQMVATLIDNDNSRTNVKTAIVHASNNALQSGDSGYLKPIHRENIYSSIPSVADSAYAQVEQGIQPNAIHGVSSCSQLSICDKSLAFYKKGFIVMCVLNFILILLNCIGLPFLYTCIQLQSPPTQQPTTTRATPNADSLNRDISCRQLRDIINISAYMKLLQNDVLKPKNGVCRIESTLDLIKILKETTTYRLSNGTDPCVKCNSDGNTQTDRLLMVAQPASTATGHFTDTKMNGDSIPHARILWMQRASPNLGFADIHEDKRSLITIPKTGYYFLFSRIHYKRKPQNQTTGFEFALGHSVVQVRSGREDLQIAEVSQKCFSNDISAEHTSILETVEKLTEGEKLYVKLSHAEMFDETDTQHSLGMFLVSN